MKRYKKWGYWLHNHTSSKDDEWGYVYARNITEATERAEFDTSRFSRGLVAPIKVFRKAYPITKVDLK